MNAGYQTVRSRFLVALVSLLMVFGNVIPSLSGSFYVYAETKTVTTWAELKAAVESAEAVDIIEISNDLVVDNAKPITVSKKITIRGGCYS